MISLTSPVETRAHGWPAGAKLAGLCAATLVLFSVEDLWFHVGALALVLGAYALPGALFLNGGLARLWILWPFVVLILAWHFLTDAWVAGMIICLRMITAVGLATLVTMTTRLGDMIAVVSWMLTPLRALGFKTRQVELAIALVIRFTPVLVHKGQMLALSWRARSARRAGWRIVTPFALMAIDDAEQVADALRARGGV